MSLPSTAGSINLTNIWFLDSGLPLQLCVSIPPADGCSPSGDWWGNTWNEKYAALLYSLTTVSLILWSVLLRKTIRGQSTVTHYKYWLGIRPRWLRTYGIPWRTAGFFPPKRSSSPFVTPSWYTSITCDKPHHFSMDHTKISLCR